MSSADIEAGGRLIQAAAAAWVDDPGGAVEVFTTPVRHETMQWGTRAERVHGITREELGLAPSTTQADGLFFEWLLAHGDVEGRRLLVTVGLNVAAFDMPFFRQTLPRSASLLHAARLTSTRCVSRMRGGI